MKLHRCITWLLMVGCAVPSEAGNGITVTILYDNTAAVPEARGDWGFACLVEGLERTILFDTGTRGEVLLHNADVLGIDLAEVQVIVLSHNHGDHTGGLAAVLEENPGVTVYFPVSFPEEYDASIQAAQGTAVRVSGPMELFAGATLTGEMGERIKEQSLILESARGLVIITGCSHQGIVEILERAAELHEEDIYLVLGGFHLMNHTDEQVCEIIERFTAMGVQQCGAAHCTGEGAMALFQEAYGEDFRPMGVGRVVQIPE